MEPIITKAAVNLSHWDDGQANGLFAHPRSNVIDWLVLSAEINFQISFDYESIFTSLSYLDSTVMGGDMVCRS